MTVLEAMHSMLASLIPQRISALIIADNMDAASKERISLITKYINKIATQNKKKRMFSHIRIFLAMSEVMPTPSPLFETARKANIGIIADTVNTIYKQCIKAGTPQRYVEYLQRLVQLGVTMVCIDDAEEHTFEQIQDMVIDVPGLRWLLSTGISTAPEVQRWILNLDTASRFEAQCYRQGEDVENVERWMRDVGMWAVAFEAFRNEDGVMTTPEEITKMGQYVIGANKKVIMVYGHDEHTDYTLPPTHPLFIGKQWNALATFLGKWWSAA